MQEGALQWLVAQFMQRLWGENYHMRVLFHLELASGHHTAHVNSCYYPLVPDQIGVVVQQTQHTHFVAAIHFRRFRA